MTHLLTLAERCEQATGPDKTLDHAIEEMVGDWENVGGARMRHKITGEVAVGYIHSPAYTASLDAAMTLVPEGALWEVEHKVNIGELFRTPEGEPERAFRGGVGVGPVPTQWRYAKHFTSPALALCAAALRARAAEQSALNREGGK